MLSNSFIANEKSSCRERAHFSLLFEEIYLIICKLLIIRLVPIFNIVYNSEW